MFDFRYYVASIAGLFLMLAVGILLGVGISGRGFVDDAERDRLNGQIEALEQEVEAASESADESDDRQRAARQFVESAYPVLVDRRLDGERVALLVLGSRDQSLDFVRRAIIDGDGRLARMRAVTLPPLWDALEGEIVEERVGDFSDPVDGVVVMRTAEPQSGDTARFLAGLYQGLGSAGAPVVGVEPSRVDVSTIPVFQRHRLSTVDGIDTELGRLALVLLLAGADPGDYGVRDTADDGIVPPIVPLPVGD